MRNIIAGIVSLATMIISVRASEASSNRWGAGYFPDVPVVTQDGKVLHFYDDLIKGRIVVINFIYTRCSDLCPIETARLAEVKDKLGDAFGRSIFFVSMSVDPEHDTPELLKAFADAFDAKAPGWQFVTGKTDDINSINAKFGDRTVRDGLNNHRQEILIGNDATGDWQRDSSFDDINQLVVTIRETDPNWHGEAAVAENLPADGRGYYHLSNQPGQALFEKACAPCHTIGGGVRIGPDLRGVVDRRDRAWLTRFIMNAPEVLAHKDPYALALAARFPGVHMPALGLGETDAADVISYLQAQTSRLSATAQNSAGPK